jgi:hypothetical protein
MREREREKKQKKGGSPGSRYSPSLRVGPAYPIDDGRGVPAPPPGATCDMRSNKMDGVGPRRV